MRYNSFSSVDLTSNLDGTATPFTKLFYTYSGGGLFQGINQMEYLRKRFQDKLVDPTIITYMQQSYGNWLALYDKAKKMPNISLSDTQLLVGLNNKITLMASYLKKVTDDYIVAQQDKTGDELTKVTSDYQRMMTTYVNNLENNINTDARQTP